MKTVTKNILKEKEMQTGNAPVSSGLSKVAEEHATEKRVSGVPAKDVPGVDLPNLKRQSHQQKRKKRRRDYLWSTPAVRLRLMT